MAQVAKPSPPSTIPYERFSWAAHCRGVVHTALMWHHSHKTYPTSYTGLVGHPLCLYFIDKTSSIGPCFSLNNQSFDTSLQDSASVLHLTEGWCSTTFTFMKETPRVSPCYSLNTGNQSFDTPLQDSANHKGVLHVTEGWCDTPSTYTT